MNQNEIMKITQPFQYIRFWKNNFPFLKSKARYWLRFGVSMYAIHFYTGETDSKNNQQGKQANFGIDQLSDKIVYCHKIKL